MSLYPNPNDGNFNIDFETIENGDYNIRIYNSTGKVINTTTRYLEAGSNSIDFSFNELPQGLYLIENRKRFEIISGIVFKTVKLIDQILKGS